MIELWIRQEDQDVAQTFSENLRKYEAIHQYDDVLTHGAMARRRTPIKEK